MRVIPISGKTCMKVLRHLGWFENNTDGRHRIYAHPTRSGYVTVPDHKELQTGTLRTIIKRAGLTIEEFYKIVDNL